MLRERRYAGAQTAKVYIGTFLRLEVLQRYGLERSMRKSNRFRQTKIARDRFVSGVPDGPELRSHVESSLVLALSRGSPCISFVPRRLFSFFYTGLFYQ